MEELEKQKIIDKLKEQIVSCRRCLLHKTRLNTVPGEGDVNASILFVGEAPGRNEDIKGKPFVGRAGVVFDKLLSSVGLTREDIYLCNILKCRPPQNRNPAVDEIKACTGSLDIQIKTINPKVIATLGNFSTAYIFDKFNLPQAQIGAVHGKVFSASTKYGEKTVVPFYHPAVATYNVNKESLLLRDFNVLRKFI